MRLAVNLLIIILVFIIINQALVNLLPAYRELLKSSENKNEVLNQLKKIEIFKKDLEAIINSPNTKYIYEAKQQGLLDIYLPSQFNDYELIILVNTIFRSSGLEEPNVYEFQDGLKDIPNLPSLKIGKKTFRVNFVTNYENLLNLLSNLENYSRFFEIENISIKKSEEGKLNIQATISYLYLSQIKPLINKQ